MFFDIITLALVHLCFGCVCWQA